MVSCDEKSGYDHVLLSEKSRTYFGIQFAGWVFTYNTIPFGWKASPYIYQSIGMAVTSYLRSKNVINIQYIDDRLAVESDSVNISKVVHILVELLTSLGYTLSLKKSQLVPSSCIRYLGFFIDSSKLAFVLPSEKKDSFIKLREYILNCEYVDVRTLQRFAGKLISFSLVLPAAKLYCREVNNAISYCLKNSKSVPMRSSLQQEIMHWRFVDNWNGCVSWRSEYHRQLLLATDSSGFRYGGKILTGNMDGVSLGDYWKTGDDRPIHLKEAEGVVKVLSSFKGELKDSRVDVFVDNMAVLKSWENQGGKDKALNDIMKQLFQLIMEVNASLKLQYISSAENLADGPSRLVSLSDSMLSEVAWKYVEQLFGPHTVDLMAIDSNCMKDRTGNSLKHFTPYPTPESAGINVFAQTLVSDENYYVFPPFQMIFPLLSFKRTKGG